jgi:hypothetical protein
MSGWDKDKGKGADKAAKDRADRREAERQARIRTGKAQPLGKGGKGK